MNKVGKVVLDVVITVVVIQIGLFVSAPLINCASQQLQIAAFKKQCKLFLKEGEWGNFYAEDGVTIIRSFQKENGKIWARLKID